MTYSEIVQEWQKKRLDSPAALAQALDNFKIIFAYHSGVIENPEVSYHNTREVFENGKIVNFSGDVRTVFEIQNQKRCYDFLLPHIINKEAITPELIKTIHYMLLQGTYDERRWERGERPGEYKKHDYVVGNDQGALPEEVAGEIEELCGEISSVKDVGDNIIKTAAYIHCKFENTHPFADGNGRVGRTLMNYFLMINNHPPLVVYNETKDIYYNALDVYDRTGDIAPFVDYMKAGTESTWGKRAKRKSSIRDIELEPPQ